jgi:hypothetical protein
VKARVESREGILAWYLQRALNANAVMSIHGLSDEQRTGPAETTNSIRSLVQRVRSRVERDEASYQTFQRQDLDEELPSISGADAPRVMKTSRAITEGVPRTFAGDEDELQPSEENLEDGKITPDRYALNIGDDHEKEKVIRKQLQNTGSSDTYNATDIEKRVQGRNRILSASATRPWHETNATSSRDDAIFRQPTATNSTAIDRHSITPGIDTRRQLPRRRTANEDRDRP